LETTSISLLRRLHQPGDATSWARFVQLYTPLLMYWARKQGLQPADAADLVQEVFVLLVEKLPQFTHDPARSFRGWLRTILVNKARDRQRRLAAQPPARNDELPALAVPDDGAALDEAEYRHHLVRRALELMQAEFEPATWKSCWETTIGDRPAAEVAAELGISTNAVYIARHRVLRRLRQELAGLLD
jgi:RNA polymerase sigma-70 factor (ECF subfamily)